jgi:murein DD-endopeptidase MepM/ murein hydrolase activator NlpD
MSPCGTRLVAARAGRVERRGYDPDLYGNFVQIDGRGEDRDYFYAHMRAPARVPLGARVRTGEPIGRVGETGNARTVGCHLHFEIHVNGRPIDPKPDLERWDRWS